MITQFCTRAELKEQAGRQNELSQLPPVALTVCVSTRERLHAIEHNGDEVP